MTWIIYVLGFVVGAYVVFQMQGHNWMQWILYAAFPVLSSILAGLVTDPKRKTAAAIVAMSVFVVVSGLAWKGQTAQPPESTTELRPAAWIAVPRPTDRVPYNNRFAGCSANIPADSSLWLVVHTDKFYPARIEAMDRGVWYVDNVTLGERVTTYTDEYEVGLWLANSQVAAELQPALGGKGTDHKPSGITELFTERVRRAQE